MTTNLNIPEEFICPITLDIMREPVMCDDGHIYDKHAITKVKNSISPFTRQPINLNNLIPCDELKNLIREFAKTNSINLESNTNIDDSSEKINFLVKKDTSGFKILDKFQYLTDAEERRNQLELKNPGTKYIIAKPGIWYPLP